MWSGKKTKFAVVREETYRRFVFCLLTHMMTANNIFRFRYTRSRCNIKTRAQESTFYSLIRFRPFRGDKKTIWFFDDLKVGAKFEWESLVHSTTRQELYLPISTFVFVFCLFFFYEIFLISWICKYPFQIARNCQDDWSFLSREVKSAR